MITFFLRSYLEEHSESADSRERIIVYCSVMFKSATNFTLLSEYSSNTINFFLHWLGFVTIELYRHLLDG